MQQRSNKAIHDRDESNYALKHALVEVEKYKSRLKIAVRAKLRLTVRKLLIKYGYPPDIARMEADRVIEQSELLAESFNK